MARPGGEEEGGWTCVSLRYFTQIVESGSLSKASRQLFIAQPALSQQLSKLEGEVGKPLLTRSSRGVAPTDNGLALYHHARFMLRQLDQALSIARKESGAVQGMVSVGLPATTVAALGLPLVRRIRERYPSILLNVVEGMSGHLGPDDAHGPAGPGGAVQQRCRPGHDGRRPAGGGTVRHAAQAQHAGCAAAHQPRRSPRPPRCRSSCPPARTACGGGSLRSSSSAACRRGSSPRSTRCRC